MRQHIGALWAVVQGSLHVGAAYRLRPRTARSSFIPLRIESQTRRYAG
jgi:hypothetical protein